MDNTEAQTIIKIFKTNLTRESCRSEFQLSRERTGFHTFLEHFGIKYCNILESNILRDFANEIISDYESGNLVNSEGTVYMMWSVVFASKDQYLPKITDILHKKFETFDVKCLQPDSACLDMNLATEMLRFPQSNTKFLERSLIYSISAIGCDLMSIKNAAQNLFSTLTKILFKDSLTLGPFQIHIKRCFKSSSDTSHFIFEINVGKRRFRHRTTSKFELFESNDLPKSITDEVVQNSESFYIGSDFLRHLFQK